MNKSEQINELAAALCAFQAEVPVIELSKSVKVATRTGGSYSFKYAPLETITEMIRPILSKHGLSYSHLMEDDAAVTTILMHKSGQWLMGTLKIDTGSKAAQEIGSAITYAKRYSLAAILGLVADEDDDANSHDGNTIKSQSSNTSQSTGSQQNNTGEKPWLNPNSPQWNDAIQFLKGKGLIGDIEKKYRISKANKENLIAAAAE